MWDAKRLLRCGERLYRAGKYALCALLIGLLVLLVLALVSLLRFGAILFVAGDAMLTAAWIAALAACAAGLLGAIVAVPLISVLWSVYSELHTKDAPVTGELPAYSSRKE